ncbi:hypothetical protein CCR75_007287 [Bremia lactucae]|uniref:Secreted protein n=1 Tax=Bremia lactucae TaxID=4779 RepID=A0A976IGW9_BRELC|nr:hypothetical protein CCR75_007287 [Bremia lactucae]
MISSCLLFSSAIMAVAMAAHIKVNHHHRGHHQKFREVTVIPDNGICPNGGDVLLCQSASFACQDDGTGKQKCLNRDDSFLDSIDSKTAAPWMQCSLTNASLPSLCLFDFQCISLDNANLESYCLPPDAWRTGRSTAKSCTTSSGEVNACDEKKYCRTKDSYQECAAAPYHPSTTSLYSDCTADGICDKSLKCKDFDNFAMCVKDLGKGVSGDED